MAQTFTSFQQNSNIIINDDWLIVDEENDWVDISEYTEYKQFQNDFLKKEKQLRNNTATETSRKEISFYPQPYDSPTKRRVINKLKYDKVWF